jgi:arylsulfate sulfotransferase
MKRLQPTLSIFTALLLAGSASAQAADTTPPAFMTQPVVTMNTNPLAPLTARVQVTSDEPVIVEIYAREATRGFRFQATEEFATTQDLPLVGFRPNRTHRITVALRDASGNRSVWPVGFVLTTPALPAHFPPIDVRTSTPSLMEAGVTLAGLRWSSPSLPSAGTYCVYFDAAGEVVWLYQAPTSLSNVVRTRDGTFLLQLSNRLVREIDLFGEIVTEWWAARTGLAGAPAGAVLVDCDSFHHELYELPEDQGGNFVALSTEVRTYPNYPTSEVDPTQTAPSANVVGDVVVEFQRDGKVVDEFRVLDVLDPYRLCYGSLAGFYNQLYGVVTLDWSHGNAATLDTSDDSWVISLRHQDAVIKVRRSDQSLVWIHGPHERWTSAWAPFLLTPVGFPFEWNFHQHSPHVDSTGNLTMFDNGNYRAIPPAPGAPSSQWYSRSVRFNVDPVAMTTTQVWDWQDSTPYFSPMFGDADPLPMTGNNLVVDGSKPVTGANASYSRLVEFRAAAPGQQVVFELVVNDPTGPSPSPYNWTIYRAERLGSMYEY